ncbi:hypothetical protein WKV44_04165 [Spirochaetia bacterium 38H-sp]|uniref:Lipoprotein n=1 Tax=Rarispira pelagica TaxID=3141764 RepID=A0ABU9UAP0_9SPIR
MNNFYKNIKYIFIILNISILFSCGLEQGYILYSIDPTTIEPLSIQSGKTGFSYSGENSSIVAFTGFELYYKFFAADSEYSSRDTFMTNETYLTTKTTIESEISNTQSVLSQYGFRRVIRTDKPSLPLIPISNKTGSYDIVVDIITDATEGKIFVSGDENYDFIIRRNVQVNGEYLSFMNLTIGQDDFTQSGSYYYLCFVVMSYGVDEQLNSIYSSAVFLKPINVTSYIIP